MMIKSSIVLFALLFIIILLSFVTAVVEKMDPDAEANLYVQKQVQNVQNDIKSVIVPITGQVREIKTNQKLIDQQYDTMSDTLSNHTQSIALITSDLNNVKSQIVNAQNMGINVGALQTQLAMIENQVSQMSNSQSTTLSAISQATQNLMSQTNSQMAQVATQVANTAFDSKIAQYNQQLQLQSLQGTNALRILSNDGSNFVVIDTSNNSAMVVSRAQNIPFEIGQMDSLTGNLVDVDVVVNGQTQSYHSLGLGSGGMAFIASRDIEGDMYINNPSVVTQISKAHIFAIPQGNISTNMLPNIDSQYASVMRVDNHGLHLHTQGLHLQYHNIISTQNGLQLCTKDGTQCTTILS